MFLEYVLHTVHYANRLKLQSDRKKSINFSNSFVFFFLQIREYFKLTIKFMANFNSFQILNLHLNASMHKYPIVQQYEWIIRYFPIII